MLSMYYFKFSLILCNLFCQKVEIPRCLLILLWCINAKFFVLILHVLLTIFRDIHSIFHMVSSTSPNLNCEVLLPASWWFYTLVILWKTLCSPLTPLSNLLWKFVRSFIKIYSRYDHFPPSSWFLVCLSPFNFKAPSIGLHGSILAPNRCFSLQMSKCS